MEIPHTALSPEALQAIIEEFVSREGTEYGVREVAMTAKVEQVNRQLQRGEIYIDFDPESQTCDLRSRVTMGQQS